MAKSSPNIFFILIMRDLKHLFGRASLTDWELKMA
jgi:hypothetical protein